MQIEIDFDIYQKLTALRKGEEDSENDVLRRILNIADPEIAVQSGEVDPAGWPVQDGQNNGVWYSNVFFPDGTRFRATYKGKTHYGHIYNAQWVDESGKVRTSPSDAAGAISGTTVNGWRFWYARLPNADDWLRLDEFKK